MTKVLIFESDHAFAVELRTELSALGCTVQVFEEGATGLVAAAQARPDLVFVSAELPRMNGFSVCNKLKKDSALQSVPVILMSSDQAQETFEQHRKLRTRADDYVRKPIRVAELLARVQQLVPIGAAHPLERTNIVIDDGVIALEPGADGFADDGDQTTTDAPSPAEPMASLTETLEREEMATERPGAGGGAVSMPQPAPSSRVPSDLGGLEIGFGLTPNATGPAPTAGARPAEPEFLQYGLGEEDDEATTTGPELLGPRRAAELARKATPGEPAAGTAPQAARPYATAAVKPNPEARSPGAARTADPRPAQALPRAALTEPPPSATPSPSTAPSALAARSPSAAASLSVAPSSSAARSFPAAPSSAAAPVPSRPPSVAPLSRVALPVAAQQATLVGAAAPSEGDGAAWQANLLQLRQLLGQAQQELQQLRPQASELSRVKGELAELRRQLAAAKDHASTSAAKEAVELREALQQRDKELLALREQATRRDREVIEAHERSSVSEQQLGQLRARSTQLESQSAEAIARVDALQGEKALAEQRAEDLKANAKKLGEQLNQRTGELCELRAKYEEEVARATTERESAVREVAERYRQELGNVDEQRRNELALLEGKIAMVERDSEQRLLALRQEQAQSLARAARDYEEKLASEHAEKEEALRAARKGNEAELERVRAEHAVVVERLRGEHSAALAQLDTIRVEQRSGLEERLKAVCGEGEEARRRADAIAEQAALFEQQRNQQLARAEQFESQLRQARDECDELASRLDGLDAERAMLVAASDSERAAREALLRRVTELEALESEHAEALRKAGYEYPDKLLEKEAHFKAIKEQLDADLQEALEEKAELTHTVSSRTQRIAVLEKSVADHEERSERIDAEVQALTERMEAEAEEMRAQYDAAIHALRGEIAATEQRLDKARRRSGEDREALQKARDALSAIISLPSEDEADGG